MTNNLQIKILILSLFCFFLGSCSLLDIPDSEQILTISSEYLVEMSSDYTVSKYTYIDSDESYYGDNDCLTEYFYYSDSVVIISDGKTVTQRGDFTKLTYYLNNKGLADSALAEIDPGHSTESTVKHYFFYDDSNYLVKDSSGSSIVTYEYSEGNMTRSLNYYPSSSVTTRSVYTFSSQESLFSFLGSFVGKPNKNLILTVDITYPTGEIQNSVFEYELYTEGLVKKATRTISSGITKTIQEVKYSYQILDK